MRYFITFFILLSSVVLFAQQFQLNTPDGSISMSISGVQNNGNTTSGNIIDQIAVKLDQVEKDCHSKLNKVDQMKAKRLMDEVYGLLALLPTNQEINVNQKVTSTTTTTTTSTPNININITGMNEEQSHKVEQKPVQKEEPKVEQKPAPPVQQDKVEQVSNNQISDSDFNSLLSKINAENFSDGKLRVLRTASKNYKFSVNQIIRLIDLFTYSDDKIEALRICYPGVTDPKNNFKILDAFTYDSDKEIAESIINP